MPFMLAMELKIVIRKKFESIKFLKIKTCLSNPFVKEETQGNYKIFLNKWKLKLHLSKFVRCTEGALKSKFIN